MVIGEVTLDDTVEKRDRNYGIQISASIDLQDDYIIRLDREVVLVKDGRKIETGGLYGERKYTIIKRLSEVQNKIITLPPMAGGITLSGGQIALALSMLTDLVALEEANK